MCLEKLVQAGTWHLPLDGMKPCLLYADDSLFFLKLEQREIQVLKIFLTIFKKIYVLSVSIKKSEILMTVDNQQLEQQIVDTLGCKKGAFSFTYLGLPLFDKKFSKDLVCMF